MECSAKREKGTGLEAYHISCGVHKFGASDTPESISQLASRRRELHSGQDHVRPLYSDTGVGYSDTRDPFDSARSPRAVVSPFGVVAALGMVPLAPGEDGRIALGTRISDPWLGRREPKGAKEEHKGHRPRN